MAKTSNEIFIKQLSLEMMVKNTVKSISHTKNILQNKDNQTDIIDVICFVDSVDDFEKIIKQLERQFYKNIHLIVISNKQTYSSIKNDKFNVDYINKNDEYKGKSFLEAKQFLKGNYFMFIDAHSVLHQRHIYKNYDF